jgi:hypothetical protein
MRTKKIFGLMIHGTHQWKKLFRRKSKMKISRRGKEDHGRKGEIPGKIHEDRREIQETVKDTGREIQGKYWKMQRSFVRMEDILKTKIRCVVKRN